MTMTSKLGVYWSVAHRRPQDYEYFRTMQPSVMKLMDGGDVDYRWISNNLPNSLVIARIHALSEQHDDMLRDPVGTGTRHAQEWNQHQQRLGFDKGKTLILGINEPRVWDTGVPEALRQYTLALCEEGAKLGLRVGAMQLSVGWPNNTGPDTPPDWSPWQGVEDVIRRGNHALVLHEYWADNGPDENWGWWAGRSLKCPWQVPIVIGECGIDMYVKDGNIERNKRGWFGRMEAKRYARELVTYVERMSIDSRFVGCCVFASDFADDDWYSFDIEPAYQAIRQTPIQSVTPTVSTKPKPTAQAIAKGTVTAHILNIRGGADSDAPNVGQLRQGDTLNIYEIKDLGAYQWYRIGQNEWVHSGWVQRTDTPAPVEEPKPVTVGIINPIVAQAILKIESGSRTHGNDGKIIIRFEAHIFKSNLQNDALWAQHFTVDSVKPWMNQQWRRNVNEPWRTIHTGDQSEEWAVFDFARSLNAEAAYQSISMGAPQIMGFNHARIGYSNAAAMFRAFQDGQMQTIAFINFCLSDPALMDAIWRKDWRTIAAKYNGTGAVDTYMPLLERAYRELGGN